MLQADFGSENTEYGKIHLLLWKTNLHVRGQGKSTWLSCNIIITWRAWNALTRRIWWCVWPWAAVPHMRCHIALGIFAINPYNTRTHFPTVGLQLNISKQPVFFTLSQEILRGLTCSKKWKAFWGWAIWSTSQLPSGFCFYGIPAHVQMITVKIVNVDFFHMISNYWIQVTDPLLNALNI